MLTGSLGAALLATVVLRLRDRAYRRLADAEADGSGQDGAVITGGRASHGG